MSTPAFPRVTAVENSHPANYGKATLAVESMEGMDLRDYFAAKAMPAIYAAIVGNPGVFAGIEDLDAYLAKEAYKVADAMIAARAKAPTPAPVLESP